MTSQPSIKALELPFDQYQRYKLATDIIQALAPTSEKPKILELGGANSSLKLFMDKDQSTVTVDMDRSDKNLDIVADSLNPPFGNSTFDVVLALDVLEHIEPDKRREFISRMSTASKKFMIIGFPGKGSDDADRLVSEFIKSRHGYEHKFFAEHIKHGLPDLEETARTIESHEFEVLMLPNGYLPRWLTMMAIHYFMDARPEYDNLRCEVNKFYNSNFYQADNAEPSYRTFLVCSRNGFEISVRKAVEGLALPTPAVKDKADIETARLLIETIKADILKDRDIEIDGLKKIISARDEEIEAVRTELEMLKDFENRVRGNPLYKLYSRIFKS